MSHSIEKGFERDTYPWIAGNLIIDQDLLHAINMHAEGAYPSECCGYIFGPSGAPRELSGIQWESNLADKYHALDPETFPRTSKEYFKIDELRAQKTFDEHAQKHEPIKVIYHSHCDAGSYFSAEDAATFANENQLMWPCAFLVVSVINGKAIDHKLWVHQPGTNNFIESRLEVR